MDAFIDTVPTYRFYPSAQYYLALTHDALKTPSAEEEYRPFSR
jgi:hypothetical protein